VRAANRPLLCEAHDALTSGPPPADCPSSRLARASALRRATAAGARSPRPRRLRAGDDPTLRTPTPRAAGSARQQGAPRRGFGDRARASTRPPDQRTRVEIEVQRSSSRSASTRAEALRRLLSSRGARAGRDAAGGTTRPSATSSRRRSSPSAAPAGTMSAIARPRRVTRTCSPRPTLRSVSLSDAFSSRTPISFICGHISRNATTLSEIHLARHDPASPLTGFPGLSRACRSRDGAAHRLESLEGAHILPAGFEAATSGVALALDERQAP
jgi:hypothetical protein